MTAGTIRCEGSGGVVHPTPDAGYLCDFCSDTVGVVDGRAEVHDRPLYPYELTEQQPPPAG